MCRVKAKYLFCESTVRCIVIVKVRVSSNTGHSDFCQAQASADHPRPH